MESSTVGAQTAARRDPGAIRVTQIGLLVAALGAFLVIFNPFGLGQVGVFLALIGAVLAAPGGLGQGWYLPVALGAIVAAISPLVADSAETLGGWLAVIGSIAVMVGATLGYPTGDES